MSGWSEPGASALQWVDLFVELEADRVLRAETVIRLRETGGESPASQGQL